MSLRYGTPELLTRGASNTSQPCCRANVASWRSTLEFVTYKIVFICRPSVTSIACQFITVLVYIYMSVQIVGKCTRLSFYHFTPHYCIFVTIFGRSYCCAKWNWRRLLNDIGLFGQRCSCFMKQESCAIAARITDCSKSSVKSGKYYSNKKARLLQREPRDAAVNFDTCQFLQRHRAASLLQHGFLVFTSDRSNAELTTYTDFHGRGAKKIAAIAENQSRHTSKLTAKVMVIVNTWLDLSYSAHKCLNRCSWLCVLVWFRTTPSSSDMINWHNVQASMPPSDTFVSYETQRTTHIHVSK